MSDDAHDVGRCIVGLPREDDPIHDVGDEDKHVTLVWLGTPDENPNLDMTAVHGAVDSVAKQAMPFAAPVRQVGLLGPDGANVAFLTDDATEGGVSQMRDALLSAPPIGDGHEAVKQYPQFTPHVTLHYPESPESAITQDQVPPGISFDRLGLWDGNDKTEYPLTGATTMTTPATELDGLEQDVNQEFEQQLVDALTRPLLLNDALSLAAAVADLQNGCGTSQLAMRPVLMKRARELGCNHVIPTDWLRSATARAARTATAPPNPPLVEDSAVFTDKRNVSGLTDTALRAAYMRGVREFTMTAPASRPPLPRDVVAQARVNSLIRLAQGDLTARTDDRDLLG